MKNLVLAFLIITFFIGCSQNSEPIKQDVYGYKLPKYGSLFVQFEWATISTRGFTDSIIFESWEFRDSTTDKGGIYRVPINRKIIKSKGSGLIQGGGCRLVYGLHPALLRQVR
ncbi:hypothetical protein ACFQ48_13195, partial [Hymenobacter caeli]